MKKVAFLIHMNMYIFIILTIISLINTQEQSKTSEESTNNIDPPKKEVTKENLINDEDDKENIEDIIFKRKTENKK